MDNFINKLENQNVFVAWYTVICMVMSAGNDMYEVL
jgi:hypothetical protein